ncbi:sensor histidine kinase [Salipaludibacillus sp. CUR1]|uniref:ATP-binding protein n=1 Tax=Salipaludibacillus sp. CUR1 TaxID=2820003 RepID=UPI001E2977C9|nr:sensor histidine kinase [Salipaludibacillus sp. CUR1]MCE7793092.1 sensor histidine kinase [Salipaludibacillus sp. CUR1]
MFSFDNYLFSLLVVLVPVFVYFAYLYKRDFFKEQSVVFGLLCCLAIIMSMSYPLELETGYIFDLRTIPWLLAFFYGGLKMGMAATAVLIIYRLFIGLDEGFFIVLVSYMLGSAAIIFFLNRFKEAMLKERIKISVCLTLLNNVLILTGIYFFMERDVLPGFFAYFMLSHLVTIILVVFIIETLKEKEQNKIALQQTERVRLIGEMAASVAHEIRNPLTVVKGFVHILKNEENLTDKQKSSLKLMDSELERAEKIITDYLSLAKSEKKNDTEIDVREIIKNTADVVEPYALMNGTTITNCIDSPYYVRGNASDLGQVFLNLFKNGIEAIDGKGEIAINAVKNGDLVDITICDTGRGMSEEEIKRLGTPFYTTKDQGTGMGTMLCYKIIDNLNGQIKVKSTRGEGTAFTISLPLCKKQK